MIEFPAGILALMVRPIDLVPEIAVFVSRMHRFGPMGDRKRRHEPEQRRREYPAASDKYFRAPRK
jgi:hypothetical protein